MTTSRQESVGVDVSILNLCPGFRAVHQLPWESSESRGHKYPSPKSEQENFIRAITSKDITDCQICKIGRTCHTALTV